MNDTSELAAAITFVPLRCERREHGSWKVPRYDEFTLRCPHGGEAVQRVTERQMMELPSPATWFYRAMITDWLRREAQGFSREFDCACGTDIERVIAVMTPDLLQRDHPKGPYWGIAAT